VVLKKEKPASGYACFAFDDIRICNTALSAAAVAALAPGNASDGVLQPGQLALTGATALELLVHL